METKDKEYVKFNYSDIVFSYYFSDECMCTKMVREHFLCYVYSGEYILEEGKERWRTIIRPGESVFVRRDNQVNMYKQPKGDEPFMGIFMMFKRPTLHYLYRKLENKEFSKEEVKHKKSVIKLPQSPDISSLFQSMTPYFNSSIKPSDEIMTLKLMEGIYALLNIDKRFYPALFDFTEPWKIDIMDYLNKNYMYDLSIDDIATFTGRSLSTFKRDFKKISNLSPEKWLTRRRLQAAYEKLQRRDTTVSEVYLEVGFKNLSHFSTAFKKEFGTSPSTI